MRQAWDATRRGGVTVAVGAGSATDMVSFSVGELFSSERKLMGCIYGTASSRSGRRGDPVLLNVSAPGATWS